MRSDVGADFRSEFGAKDEWFAADENFGFDGTGRVANGANGGLNFGEMVSHRRGNCDEIGRPCVDECLHVPRGNIAAEADGIPPILREAIHDKANADLVHFFADGKTDDGFAHARSGKFFAEYGKKGRCSLGTVVFFGFADLARLPKSADFVQGGRENVLVDIDRSNA